MGDAIVPERKIPSAELREKASGRGSLALLVYAITALMCNFSVVVILQTYVTTMKCWGGARTFTRKSYSPVPIQPCTTSFQRESESREDISWTAIRRLWGVSHLVFAGCMIGIMQATTYDQMLCLMAPVGCCWAVNIWAPYALTGKVITGYLMRSEVTDPGQNNESCYDELIGREGMVMGLHNVAIAVPQVLALVICAAIFSFMDSEQQFGPVFSVGIVSGLVAAYKTIYC